MGDVGGLDQGGIQTARACLSFRNVAPESPAGAVMVSVSDRRDEGRSG